MSGTSVGLMNSKRGLFGANEAGAGPAFESKADSGSEAKSNPPSDSEGSSSGSLAGSPRAPSTPAAPKSAWKTPASSDSRPPRAPASTPRHPSEQEFDGAGFVRTYAEQFTRGERRPSFPQLMFIASTVHRKHTFLHNFFIEGEADEGYLRKKYSYHLNRVALNFLFDVAANCRELKSLLDLEVGLDESGLNNALSDKGIAKSGTPDSCDKIFGVSVQDLYKLDSSARSWLKENLSKIILAVAKGDVSVSVGGELSGVQSTLSEYISGFWNLYKGFFKKNKDLNEPVALLEGSNPGLFDAETGSELTDILGNTFSDTGISDDVYNALKERRDTAIDRHMDILAYMNEKMDGISEDEIQNQIFELMNARIEELSPAAVGGGGGGGGGGSTDARAAKKHAHLDGYLSNPANHDEFYKACVDNRALVLLVASDISDKKIKDLFKEIQGEAALASSGESKIVPVRKPRRSLFPASHASSSTERKAMASPYREPPKKKEIASEPKVREISSSPYVYTRAEDRTVVVNGSWLIAYRKAESHFKKGIEAAESSGLEHERLFFTHMLERLSSKFKPHIDAIEKKNMTAVNEIGNNGLACFLSDSLRDEMKEADQSVRAVCFEMARSRIINHVFMQLKIYFERQVTFGKDIQARRLDVFSRQFDRLKNASLEDFKGELNQVFAVLQAHSDFTGKRYFSFTSESRSYRNLVDAQNACNAELENFATIGSGEPVKSTPDLVTLYGIGQIQEMGKDSVVQARLNIKSEGFAGHHAAKVGPFASLGYGQTWIELYNEAQQDYDKRLRELNKELPGKIPEKKQSLRNEFVTRMEYVGDGLEPKEGTVRHELKTFKEGHKKAVNRLKDIQGLINKHFKSVLEHVAKRSLGESKKLKGNFNLRGALKVRPATSAVGIKPSLNKKVCYKQPYHQQYALITKCVHDLQMELLALSPDAYDANKNLNVVRKMQELMNKKIIQHTSKIKSYLPFRWAKADAHEMLAHNVKELNKSLLAAA